MTAFLAVAFVLLAILWLVALAIQAYWQNIRYSYMAWRCRQQRDAQHMITNIQQTKQQP